MGRFAYRFLVLFSCWHDRLCMCWYSHDRYMQDFQRKENTKRHCLFSASDLILLFHVHAEMQVPSKSSRDTAFAAPDDSDDSPEPLVPPSLSCRSSRRQPRAGWQVRDDFSSHVIIWWRFLHRGYPWLEMNATPGRCYIHSEIGCIFRHGQTATHIKQRIFNLTRKVCEAKTQVTTLATESRC